MVSELLEPGNVGIVGASVSEKLEHTLYSPYWLSEFKEPGQKKTAKIFGAMKFVGISGASMSDRWE